MKNYEVTSAGGYISRGGTTGLLGSNDTMDVPFTQLNLTQKVIEDYGEPTLALDSILINSPNVRGGTTLHNDFSIRGITVQWQQYVYSWDSRVDDTIQPYFAERIDSMTGPNSALTVTMPTYENSFAGGIVNFVSKTASDESTDCFCQRRAL